MLSVIFMPEDENRRILKKHMSEYKYKSFLHDMEQSRTFKHKYTLMSTICLMKCLFQRHNYQVKTQNKVSPITNC